MCVIRKLVTFVTSSRNFFCVNNLTKTVESVTKTVKIGTAKLMKRNTFNSYLNVFRT